MERLKKTLPLVSGVFAILAVSGGLTVGWYSLVNSDDLMAHPAAIVVLALVPAIFAGVAVASVVQSKLAVRR